MPSKRSDVIEKSSFESCQRVVTVTDEAPPAFIRIPPPVRMTTGPDATLCGAVVGDSDLVGPGSNENPLTFDRMGDVRDPSSPLQHDIASSNATFDSRSLTFTVSFDLGFEYRVNLTSESRQPGFVEVERGGHTLSKSTMDCCLILRKTSQIPVNFAYHPSARAAFLLHQRR
jgi:hypothetical protein